METHPRSGRQPRGARAAPVILLVGLLGCAPVVEVSALERCESACESWQNPTCDGDVATYNNGRTTTMLRYCKEQCLDLDDRAADDWASCVEESTDTADYGWDATACSAVGTACGYPAGDAD